MAGKPLGAPAATSLWIVAAVIGLVGIATLTRGDTGPGLVEVVLAVAVGARAWFLGRGSSPHGTDAAGPAGTRSDD